MALKWKRQEISDTEIGTCTIWTCPPGGREPKHYHNAIEITYVLKGNCKTHKQGKVYVYKPGDIHEVINDSEEEIVFIITSIPPYSEQNTFYVSSNKD